MDDRMKPWIIQAAGSVSKAYSSWITFADTANTLWLWAIENEQRVNEYLSQPDGERIVRSILSREARTYAIKERSVSTGFSPEDVAWYGTNQIKAVLPDVFDYEDWQSFGSGGDGRSKPLVNMSGDRLATILDVKSGLAKLHEVPKQILELVYGTGASLEFVAAFLGISEDAARKRLDRAVKALAGHLNNPRPTDPYEAVNGQFDTRTKGRKAISNATAQARTSHNWDGE